MLKCEDKLCVGDCADMGDSKKMGIDKKGLCCIGRPGHPFLYAALVGSSLVSF